MLTHTKSERLKSKIEEEDDNLYRDATEDESAWLDSQETVKVYRAMQVIDGKLTPE